MNGKILPFLLLILIFHAQAQTIEFRSGKLQVQIDSASGGIHQILIKDDIHRMNWIMTSDGKQYPWQTADFGWGMGSCVVNGDSVKWNKPYKSSAKNHQINYWYDLKKIQLMISRKSDRENRMTESFHFINKSDEAVSISEIGICTPFNDNYPDSKQCVEGRCNTHVWANGSDSYVFAERMGGDAPHLGLVLTRGALKSYSILNRSRNVYAWNLSASNTRGTIVLNPENVLLKPGESYDLIWNIFPANNWNEFFDTAIQLGNVKATAQKYVIENDEILRATFTANRKLKDVRCFLNDNIISFSQKGKLIKITAKPSVPGEQVLRLEYYHGKKSVLKAFYIPDIRKLLAKRAQFIVSKQQMNDTADARYGAYMVYDNEIKRIYLNDDARKSSDLNEARERVGMGVFLAMYLQQYPDEKIKNSLLRFTQYVKTKLQKKDYTVLDGLTSNRQRIYNYPWVASLYLEMYRLTRETVYLIDYYYTSRKYFIDGKYHFYGIGLPISEGLAELKKAGMNQEYDSLLMDCRKTAANYLATGLYFPKHEVNYEQSIIAPSVVFLLEMYQVTADKRYLTEAEKQLKALETFGGQQPDYHLHDIAIRHWDGYWFGKREFWGDIFPHYWSTITSEAFSRYGSISGKKEYLNRAETIVKNNLCNFFDDGSASCVYVYPSQINGNKAAFFDPFANDQDWALVFYLKYKRIIQSTAQQSDIK
jgi:hypothetical protein